MMCTGKEKHRHTHLATGQDIWHSHQHSAMEEDFNRLHHHPPLEHQDLTREELHQNIDILKVPF